MCKLLCSPQRQIELILKASFLVTGIKLKIFNIKLGVAKMFPSPQHRCVDERLKQIHYYT